MRHFSVEVIKRLANEGRFDEAYTETIIDLE